MGLMSFFKGVGEKLFGHKEEEAPVEKKEEAPLEMGDALAMLKNKFRK